MKILGQHYVFSPISAASSSRLEAPVSAGTSNSGLGHKLLQALRRGQLASEALLHL